MLTTEADNFYSVYPHLLPAPYRRAMGALKLVSGPSTEPLDLGEVKTFGRIIETDSDEESDALLRSLITAARRKAEAYTGRSFINTTWDFALDRAPDKTYLQLPVAPLSSVTSVTYYPDTDVATAWASSNYIVDTYSEPGRITLKTGASWPSDLRPSAAFVVRFVAGYGSLASDVPEDIRQALRILVQSHSEHREGDKQIPPLAADLLSPYKLWRL